MSARLRLGDALRAVDRRAPQSARATVRRAADAVRRRDQGPLVSVIVTASDEDAEYLGEALTSVGEQTHAHLEIIVVPHGRADQVVELVSRHLADDYRLRLLRRALPTQGHARERGVRLARGEYLCFLRGQDVLPPRAVARGVASLGATGSDLALGRLDKAPSLAPSVLPVHDPVHVETRAGTNLAEFPVAITDTELGNRLIRTSFWRRAGIDLGAIASEAEAATLSLLHAHAFDVLSLPTYRDMNRSHGTPVEQLYDSTADLADWLDAAAATHARLTAQSAELGDHWARGALDRTVPGFLGDAERMSPAQWQGLRDVVAPLWEGLPADLRALVRAEARVKVALLLADRRGDLEELVAARWFERDNVPTAVVDGQIHALLPFYGDAGLGADPFVMHAWETPARVDLREIRTADEDHVELDLLARIELLDLADTVPDIRARLVSTAPDATADPIELPVAQHADAHANFTVTHHYQDYRPGGCTVTLALGAVPEGVWHLEVSVSARGVTRSTIEVMARDQRYAGGLIGTRYEPVRWTAAGTSVHLDRDPDQRVTVRVRQRRLPVAFRDAEIAGRTVRLTLDGPGVTAVRATRGRESIRGRVADGVVTLELPGPAGTGFWSLQAEGPEGPSAIAWPDAAGEPFRGDGRGSLVAARSAAGTAELLEVADTAVVDRAELRVGEIEVRGHWLGAPPAEARIELRGPRHGQTARVETAADGSLRAVFSTTWDPWDLGPATIPADGYHLALSCGPGRAARAGSLVVGMAYLASTQHFQLSEELRLRPLRARSGEPMLNLAPPLPLEYTGAYPQERLRREHLDSDRPVDPTAVYLSVYAGASATDSQLAIHHELRRTRPDLTLYWGVADTSARVPEGGIPLVIGTPEWFRVITTAGYLVQNIDLDRWFRKRPGQRFLQTFHGYPAKSMGLRMWVAKNFTPRRLQAELDRTSAGWDLILTPAPEMDVHYRTEYAYDGPIESAGYPRDDALVQDSAALTRKHTRERLGVRPEQKVVLYAPTWRDHLAMNYRSAKMAEYLDVQTASEALGDDYVILLRGHRFHSRGTARSEGTARLVDVTDYPEINDLILASDAAVLDYSSLRFDFALTGRPMVFLVPDLADYTGGIRGFLMDYRDTAPGPLLETADEVVAALADLPALERAYGERIAAFNARYNYLQDGRAAERVVARFFTRD